MAGRGRLHTAVVLVEGEAMPLTGAFLASLRFRARAA